MHWHKQQTCDVKKFPKKGVLPNVFNLMPPAQPDQQKYLGSLSFFFYFFFAMNYIIHWLIQFHFHIVF